MDDFDPNVPCPNYKQRLKEHYARIKNKLQIPDLGPIQEGRIEIDLLNIVDAKPTPKPAVTESHLSVVLSDDEKENIKAGKLAVIDREGARRSPLYFLKKVCAAYDTTIDEIQGAKKTKELVRLRANIVQTFYVMYPNNLSSPQLGMLLNRDHSTIIHLKTAFNIKEDETIKNYSNIKFDKHTANKRQRRAKKTETPHV